MKPTLVVLAAGMGSRYGGLKQIDPFGPNGESIIDYSVFDAIRAGFGKVVFVIRKSIEADFKSHFGNRFEKHIEVAYVYQELDLLPSGYSVPDNRQKPWGTGHALLVSRDKVNEPFAVINADDFYGAESYMVMFDYLSKQSADSTDYCLLGYNVENTLSEHGSVSRGVCEVDESNFLTGVTERTKIFKKEQEIVFEVDGNLTTLKPSTPVSMNFMGFAPSAYDYFEREFSLFLKDNIQNPKSEFYMPYVLNILINSEEAKVKVLSTPGKWFGVTYQEDREAVKNSIAQLINDGKYPDKLW